ncbi:hypothetical protein PHLGIDRAFT_121631 [Phlebiopsis gigantea 11061_1 CR5-6]|uniref:Cytochrome P450 n=1 Tax=Phlebiopsis gigantea (strain 11061_1 CR5-6) TaxID=745531 RepID=A0A0C3S5A0_PHLG1|nr:hypothetical protein PHLGIDRAFT_121631 [Phlebiopsis gigantea 11061_1 CR5-6]
MFILLDVLVIAIAVLSSYWIAGRRQSRHLPPGPSGLPVLGNALQIPRGREHLAFVEMGRSVGSDIVALKIPGQTFLVLNSHEAISDLLGQAADGWSGNVTLANNTPRFRTCRKLMRKGLGPSAVRSFAPFLQRQNPFLLAALVRSPDSYDEVFKRATGRISMKIAYGYHGVEADEELFDLAVEANRCFDETAVFGVWMVDLFPALKHIPSWFPGAEFKRYAARAHAVVTNVVNKPFDAVKEHMREGTADGSYSSMLLQSEQGNADTEDCIKWTAGSIFTGQMNTTTATLSWFLPAMALHPDVQMKAQISDRDALPYVTAVVREVLRWHPVVDLIPRATAHDDEYRGFFIPAKTAVIANVWAVLRDESVYPQADRFILERFLEHGARAPTDAAFGFGRRICPGILIADESVFLSIASMLATLDISKAKDAAGRAVEPVVEGLRELSKTFQGVYRAPLEGRCGSHTPVC